MILIEDYRESEEKAQRVKRDGEKKIEDRG